MVGHISSGDVHLIQRHQPRRQDGHPLHHPRRQRFGLMCQRCEEGFPESQGHCWLQHLWTRSEDGKSKGGEVVEGVTTTLYRTTMTKELVVDSHLYIEKLSTFASPFFGFEK